VLHCELDHQGLVPVKIMQRARNIFYCPIRVRIFFCRFWIDPNILACSRSYSD
jgi:hypothetical protein